jgi:hypothetical protein
MKKRLLSTLVFSLFLIGSTILYYEVGRWASIGVGLEVLAIYILIKLEIKSLLESKGNVDEEIDDTD